MARLSHPNVIAVHDVGVLDDQVFIAMELIEGDTLGTWMKTRHGWRETLAVFVPAARGLAAAHHAGLVHRDFKPDNVLIDGVGRVCVLDFGLARPVAGPLDGDLLGHDLDAAESTGNGAADHESPAVIGSALTRTGALMGTPAYMAPEQLRRQPTSPRTDQFSFCVALYQALYGERPFAGETVDDLAPNLLGGKVRPPPSDSSVPKWLRQVVMRGLLTNPDARFESMDALIGELLRDPAAVRRRWLGVAALVGLGGLSLFAVERSVRRDALSCRSAAQKMEATWDGPRRAALAQAFAHTGTPYAAAAAASTTSALDGYAARWTALRVDACEATRVRGEQSAELLDLRMSCLDRRQASMKALVDLLVHADRPLVDRALAAVEQLPDLDGCSDATALRSPVHLPADPAVRARISDVQTQLAAATALSQAGKYADSAHVAEALLPTAEATGYRPLEAETLLAAAAAEDGGGDFKAAERHFTDAALAAAAGRDDVGAAFAWARLVMVVGYDEARYADGLTWARYARAALERLGGNPRIEAVLLTGEGTIYVEQGHPDLAQPAHERALALQEKLFGPDSAEVATTLLHLGFDYFSRGQLDGALTAYQRSLDIREKRLGADHPLCATSLINVGNVYYQKRDLPKAATYYQRALTIQEASVGPDHLSVASSLNNLGNVFSDQKDWGPRQRRLSPRAGHRRARTRPRTSFAGGAHFQSGRRLCGARASRVGDRAVRARHCPSDQSARARPSVAGPAVDRNRRGLSESGDVGQSGDAAGAGAGAALRPSRRSARFGRDAV